MITISLVQLHVKASVLTKGKIDTDIEKVALHKLSAIIVSWFEKDTRVITRFDCAYSPVEPPLRRK